MMGIIGSNYCEPNYYMVSSWGTEHFQKQIWNIKMTVKFMVVMWSNISSLLLYYINCFS